MILLGEFQDVSKYRKPYFRNEECPQGTQGVGGGPRIGTLIGGMMV